MKIIKQLNLNIVIASDAQGRKIVLMGKCIGLSCKTGMEPDMEQVEKTFYRLSDSRNAEQFIYRLSVLRL